jgi:hypothetical protein
VGDAAVHHRQPHRHRVDFLGRYAEQVLGHRRPFSEIKNHYPERKRVLEHRKPFRPWPADLRPASCSLSRDKRQISHKNGLNY